MRKKGQGLPLNVIIIAVIVLVVLVVLWVIFTSRAETFVDELGSCRGECKSRTACVQDGKGAVAPEGLCDEDKNLPLDGREKSVTGGPQVCCIVLGS